jgi:hypothetical protein
LELYQGVALGEQYERETKTFPFPTLQAHTKDFIIHAAPKGGARRERRGKAGKEAKRLEVMFSLHCNPHALNPLNSKVTVEIRHLLRSRTLEPRCATAQACRDGLANKRSDSFSRLRD